MNYVQIHIKNRQLWNIGMQLHSIIRNSSSETVEIPYRIERGPTDILKAIESTVSRDPTSMAYQYIDDPYLIPHSTYTARTYLLSMDAGKRAAMWIQKEHADLFQHKISDPLIDKYIPRPAYADKNQVSEEMLMDSIRRLEVEEASIIYDLLEQKVSDETKLSLFQLLCYYNNKIPEHNEFPSEKWFSIDSQTRNRWVDKKIIEDLFKYLSTHADPHIVGSAHNTLFCGYVKYDHFREAENLIEKIQIKKYPITLNSYNSWIKLYTNKHINIDDQWNFINSILKEMKKNKVHPNVKTLNFCLQKIPSQKDNLKYIKHLLEVFMNMGIKPCLSTYYFTLMALQLNKQLQLDVLREIINKLRKEKKLEIADYYDGNFFLTAMNIANKMSDLPLAETIHDILLFEDNFKFIGSGLFASKYYFNYTLLKLSTESISNFVEFYKNLVPSLYIPELHVYEEILKKLTTKFGYTESVEFIPLFWNHIVVFDYIKFYKIGKLFFNLLTNLLAEIPNERLIKEYAFISWKYFEIIKELSGNTRKTSPLIYAEIFVHVLILLMKNSMFEEAKQVFNFLNGNKDNVIGAYPELELEKIMNECILKNHAECAFYTLELVLDSENDNFNSLGESMRSLSLSPNEEQLLNSLLASRVKQPEEIKTEAELKKPKENL